VHDNLQGHGFNHCNTLALCRGKDGAFRRLIISGLGHCQPCPNIEQKENKVKRCGEVHGPARRGRGGARSRRRYDRGAAACARTLDRLAGARRSTLAKRPLQAWRGGPVRSSCFQKIVYLKVCRPECRSASVARIFAATGRSTTSLSCVRCGLPRGRVERPTAVLTKKLPHRRRSRKQVPRRSMIWRAGTCGACPLLSGNKPGACLVKTPSDRPLWRNRNDKL
jgi:hypothetical protein